LECEGSIQEALVCEELILVALVVLEALQGFQEFQLVVLE
jgi:hypothetical protein